MVARIVALLALLAPSALHAEPDDEAGRPDRPPAAGGQLPARGTPLVGAKATWRWAVITAPRIAPQIGALAVSGVDVVAGRQPSPAAVLGDPVPEPAHWPYEVDGDLRVIPPPGDDQRIAAAYGVTTFTLTAADQTLEMLELRLAYEDGVAAWLNGTEIVRQALPRGRSTDLASRPHGPEWETFYIPIAPGLLRLGANTLAIEVHPSGRRLGPKLAADLIGRRDRGIVRGPIIADAGATTATIAVETDPGVDAVLEWGRGDQLDQRQTSPVGRRHVFQLTGLPEATAISYRVIAGAARSPRASFHTMPAKGAVIRFGVYGDVRGGHSTHHRLVGHMMKEALDFIAVTGDMVLHGSDDADWQRFFAVTGELLAQVPYYPAVGNHDLGWDGADGTSRADELLSLPPGPPNRPEGAFWYSRDVADVHLVFLDSNAYDRPEQEVWLEVDLAAARARRVRAIVVFTHDGPYARGYHGGNAIARARYVPILARHHVDLVFAGHDHLYQRGEHGGIRYVVTGGGGASLYGIRCGVDGRPKCATDDGMIAIAREHHFAVVAIARDLELCVRRVDGTLLEKCVRLPLWRG